LLLQVDNVDLSRWLRGHIPDPERPVFHVLVRRQDGVEKVLVVLRLRFLVELARLWLATLLLGFQLRGHQVGVVVLEQRLLGFRHHY